MKTSHFNLQFEAVAHLMKNSFAKEKEFFMIALDILNRDSK